MTDRPFTVAICQAGPCRGPAGGPDVMGRMAAVIRRCPHAVLVRTGCMLRASRCRTGAAHDSGCYLWVQPCDTRRRPRGPVITVGPVLTRQDAESVAAWLDHGDLNTGRLAPGLRAAGA